MIGDATRSSTITSADTQIYLSRAYEQLNSHTCCCCIPIRIGLLLICIIMPLGTLFETIFGPLGGAWTLWVIESFMIVLSIYGFYGVWTMNSQPIKKMFWWMLVYIICCIIIVLYEIAEWNEICDKSSSNLHSCHSDSWKTSFLIQRSLVVMFSMYFIHVIQAYTRQVKLDTIYTHNVIIIIIVIIIL